MLIKLNPENRMHGYFSYLLLSQRYANANTINITGNSLPLMPTIDDHLKWLGNNCDYDYFIWLDPSDNIQKAIATIRVRYNSKQDITLLNEVGIFVLDEFQGMGIGTKALTELFTMYPNKLYAKINPQNEKSQNLFKKLNFTHVANIWRCDEKKPI